MSDAAKGNFYKTADVVEYRMAAEAAQRLVSSLVGQSVAVVNYRVASLDAARARVIGAQSSGADMASKLAAFDKSDIALILRGKIEKSRKIALAWQKLKISQVATPWYIGPLA